MQGLLIDSGHNVYITIVLLFQMFILYPHFSKEKKGINLFYNHLGNTEELIDNGRQISTGLTLPFSLYRFAMIRQYDWGETVFEWHNRGHTGIYSEDDGFIAGVDILRYCTY